MTKQEALKIVLELAEQNALDVDMVANDPCLEDEAERQAEALRTVRAMLAKGK